MTAPRSVIRVRGLAIRMGDAKILESVDLDVHEGEILGLAGATGAGKSTLARAILGLEPIAAGTIEMFGRGVASLSRAERRNLEQRRGVLFQDGALFGALNVAQNVQVPMRERGGLPAHLMDDLAALKIAMVGLPSDAAGKFPAELSGGMRKRAGLARALAMDPEILILDEPTSGLDPIGAADFDQLIARLSHTLGLTVLLITHDLDTIFTVCDRVAVLADGRIVRVAAPGALARDPNHPWVEAYFRGARARAVTGEAPTRATIVRS